MSVMCCVYVPEGIILAADSRLTQTKSSLLPQVIKQGEKEINSFSIKETVYTLSDNAQKVILIKKNIEPQFLTKEFITISTLTCILIKLKMNLLK